MNRKKGRTNLLIIMCTALFITGSVSVCAAESDETAETEARNVVITATRTEQEVKEVPASVAIITAEELAARGAVTLQQALEMATSVYSGKDSHSRAMVGMRGFDTRHTLILIDGKRISSEIGSETTYELTRITMESVERIEVIRGPVSALYGSDAMGGVVNIITKQPLKPQFELQMEGKRYSDSNSEGGYDWLARYDAGKKGRFGWSFSFGENRVDPLYNEAGTATFNYYGYVRPFNFKSVLDVSKSAKLTFDYDRMEEKIKKESSTTSLLKYDNERNGWSLAYEDKTKAGDTFLRLYRSVYDKDYETRNPATGALKTFDLVTRESTTLEGKITREWGENHLVTAGWEYQQEDFKGTRFDTGKGSYTVSREGISNTGTEGQIKYYAGYVQDEWVVNDRLLIIPAIRIDDSDAYESAFSPKLGITYKMRPNLRLKASAGLGFKTPSLLNTYYSYWHNTATISKPTSGLFIIGNPNLKPERSQTFEIGLEGERGATAGRIMFFHNKIKDYIESYYTGATRDTTALLGFPSSDRYMSYHNIPYGSIYGVETELEHKLSDKFSFSANYTYLDARNDMTGARLVDKPRHQIGAGLSYNDKAHGITGRVWGTVMVNTLASTADDMSKTYGIWSFLLNKEITKSMTVYAGIDNFLNKYDEDLKIYGAVYRTGLRFKF